MWEITLTHGLVRNAIMLDPVFALSVPIMQFDRLFLIFCLNWDIGLSRISYADLRGTLLIELVWKFLSLYLWIRKPYRLMALAVVALFNRISDAISIPDSWSWVGARSVQVLLARLARIHDNATIDGACLVCRRLAKAALECPLWASIDVFRN